MNDYRIDKVPYISADIKDYKVPLGMNTIMWLGGFKPNLKQINAATNCIRKPTDVFLLSTYCTDKKDYTIYQIIFPLDYNGEQIQ